MRDGKDLSLLPGHHFGLLPHPHQHRRDSSARQRSAHRSLPALHQPDGGGKLSKQCRAGLLSSWAVELLPAPDPPGDPGLPSEVDAAGGQQAARRGAMAVPAAGLTPHPAPWALHGGTERDAVLASLLHLQSQRPPPSVSLRREPRRDAAKLNSCRQVLHVPPSLLATHLLLSHFLLPASWAIGSSEYSGRMLLSRTT